MTAAKNNKSIPKSSLRLTGLGILAAAFIGAAFYPRGSDTDSSLLPEMAAAPFVLSSGAKLYIQKYEVTVAEWNTCHADGGCTLNLRVRADQDASAIPATGLSYVDVNEYLAWINDRTGRAFRLPTATEWTEMAAAVLPEEPDPIFTDPSLTWASTYLTEESAPRTLKPRGSYSVSPEGVADLDGSVWEWTQECYAGSANGIADPKRCPAFFVGGEHVAAMSYLVRDPARGGCAVGTPPAHLGMRLVTEEASWQGTAGF